MTMWELLMWLLLIPVIGGSVYAILSTIAVLRFFGSGASATPAGTPAYPPVTVLKPVYGLEKNLKANLRSICEQDYPQYQVVFCAQDPEDPAVPIVKEIQEEFGPALVSVVIKDLKVGSNGKVNNLLSGLTEARHEILVISDSDTVLKPNHLKTLIAPFSDAEVGAVCSLFKAIGAERWVEKLELLTINADFLPGVIFAHITGAAKFCLGPSLAIRRATLYDIGGLEALADYLVEDYEVGRRVWASGKKVALASQVIEVIVDLKSLAQWWSHQLYWDINLRLANPGGFFATVFVRSVPFALLFAIVRLGDPISLTVLSVGVGLRLVTAGASLYWGFGDREGLKSLGLMPLRDVLGLLVWCMAFIKRTVVWRGVEYQLTSGGKMAPRQRDRALASEPAGESAVTR